MNISGKNIMRGVMQVSVVQKNLDNDLDSRMK